MYHICRNYFQKDNGAFFKIKHPFFGLQVEIFIIFTGNRDGGRGGGPRGVGRNRSQGWVDYEYNYEAAGIDRKGSANNRSVS